MKDFSPKKKKNLNVWEKKNKIKKKIKKIPYYGFGK